MQEDASSVTAEKTISDSGAESSREPSHRTARLYAVVSAVMLILGLADLIFVGLQRVLPDLLDGIEFLGAGRLGPSSRFFLLSGWVVTGLLGASMFAISSSTRTELRRSPLASAGLLLMVVGSLGGSFGIMFGLQSGIVGFEAPLWARAIMVAGWVLAALSISATAKAAKDEGPIGVAGWYVTAGAWWLAASGVVSLVPPIDGIGGTIQVSFSQAAIVGLFVIVSSVGLLYHATARLSGTDLASPRPLAALGFWSLAITWGSMSATPLIFSAVPDWYETLGVALAIAAFVPILTIATDLGLMLKGTVADIADRATLRYGIVSFLALALATVVNFLLTWRSTSAVVGHTSAVTGRDLLISAGVASFALFASHTLLQGGRESGSSLHFSWSIAGLVGVALGTVAGGVVAGFSWASGPASGTFPNAGPAWEITTVSMEPFAWITAASVVIFFAAQFAHLGTLMKGPHEPLSAASGAIDYDLEFEGAVPVPTWRRLVVGATLVWLFAALFTGVFPAIDPANSEATILGDNVRDLPAGSIEADGRNVYISEGCVECHTQSVRPVGTDVGLGPVSQAGDYLHESPVLLGNVRIGPDLMHIASQEGFDRNVVATYLKDPRAVRDWSTMPSYDYLSDADLEALVSYIETLR